MQAYYARAASKKAAAAKRKEGADGVCKTVTSCVIDGYSDNIVHCSAYANGEKYECSVILNDRFNHYKRVWNDGVMKFTKLDYDNTTGWTEGLHVNWNYTSERTYNIEKRGSRY